MLIGLVYSLGCTKPQEVQTAQPLEEAKGPAVGPYFTRDQEQRPVLCWSEQTEKDGPSVLRYAVYDQENKRFSHTVTVAGSLGCSTSPESMAKVAFKADGTIIALFGKRFTTEKNPYAGAICYTSSTDKGVSWSPAKYLHSDTAHHYGRSFFDIERTADGELATAWLDGRYGKSIKGSALFFARTKKGQGFDTELCLQKGTCECCRTELLSDDQGNLHLAYRSIMMPSLMHKEQVRDMAYLKSTDGGKHWSSPVTISDDQWKIDGCPHSGPTLAKTGNELNVGWFTAGGGPGLYFTHQQQETGFRTRMLVSAAGRHPQMATSQGSVVAMVYEEGAVGASEGAGHAHGTSGLSKIRLQPIAQGKMLKGTDLTDGTSADHHAVLIPLQNTVLVAWIRESLSGPKIYYQEVVLAE